MTITLAEMARLVMILRSDPSSAIASTLAGWAFPISREALAIYDLYDLTHMANSDLKKGRPQPHGGRPYSIDDKERTRKGDAAGRTREEVLAILREHGHQIPV